MTQQKIIDQQMTVRSGWGVVIWSKLIMCLFNSCHGNDDDDNGNVHDDDDDDNDDENGDHNDDDDDDDKINRNSGQWLSLPISPLRCFAQSLTPSPPSSSS